MDKKEKLIEILSKLMPGVTFDDTALDELIGLIDTIANEKCDVLASELGVEREKVAAKDKELEQFDDEASMVLQDVSDKMEEMYKQKLTKAEAVIAEHMEAKMATKLSNYLDTQLTESMPEKLTVDYGRLQMLEGIFEEVRGQLLITDKFMKDNVKEAIVEGQKIISQKDKELSNLMVESANLRKQVNLLESKNLIEEKTKDMPTKKAAYVRNFLNGVTAKGEVEQKLNEAITAYDLDEESTRQKLINEAKSSSGKRILELPKSKLTKVEPTVINESINLMDSYVEKLQQISNPLKMR